MLPSKGRWYPRFGFGDRKLEAAKTGWRGRSRSVGGLGYLCRSQLASELKPDLRMAGWDHQERGGVKDVAAPAIDGALPQVRSAAGLEPMFAIKDQARA